LVFFVFGILIPVVETGIRWIKAICHPITFPYKHVLITGCGTGLGKALVQEIFMKGAFITMIGRDQEKLLKLAEQVDVSDYFEPIVLL
jgi:D-arabinose 1-dehydrogenase-like Zn-dependent alcohol dehydrogenase